MTNKNIFVACDVSSQKEILNLLDLIHSDISGIKIGLQYITQRSPEEIKELSKFNKPIFYDGKFYDIKNTLVESIKSLEKLIHTSISFKVYLVDHFVSNRSNKIDRLFYAELANRSISDSDSLKRII